MDWFTIILDCLLGVKRDNGIHYKVSKFVLEFVKKKFVISICLTVYRTYGESAFINDGINKEDVMTGRFINVINDYVKFFFIKNRDTSL